MLALLSEVRAFKYRSQFFLETPRSRGAGTRSVMKLHLTCQQRIRLAALTPLILEAACALERNQ